MKKQKVSRVETPFDPSVFETKGALPSLEIANQAIQELTGQVKQTGRPIKNSAIGRVKFTTAIRSDVVKWLKIRAVEQGVSPADVLEEALLAFMGNQ
jgi:hypothetical protein